MVCPALLALPPSRSWSRAYCTHPGWKEQGQGLEEASALSEVSPEDEEEFVNPAPLQLQTVEWRAYKRLQQMGGGHRLSADLGI